MAPINLDVNEVGLRDVFAGMPFPAPRWRLIAQASYWGAGCECITELVCLPARQYRDLADLAGALHELREKSATVVYPSRLVRRRPLATAPVRQSA